MIRKRVPPFQSILPVFAIIAFMVYGWTLLTYLRYLSYWLRFLNLGEIYAIFSYSMLADLAESVLIISILLGFCLILPPRFLKETFVVRGTLIVILMLGSMAAFLNYFSSLDAYMFTVLPWGAVSLLVAVLVAVFAPRSAFVSRAAVWFSDSMIIFLYIFMPVTILSLLVVLVRNII